MRMHIYSMTTTHESPAAYISLPRRGVYLHILKLELDSKIYLLDNLEKYLLAVVLHSIYYE
jgi:hypothetical protein